MKNADNPRYTSKTKMFENVRENLDEHLGRLEDLVEKFEDHDFLNHDPRVKKTFDDASEMLKGLSDEVVLRPYKEFLDRFNKIEAMLNEVKARCLYGR